MSSDATRAGVVHRGRGELSAIGVIAAIALAANAALLAARPAVTRWSFARADTVLAHGRSAFETQLGDWQRRMLAQGQWSATMLEGLLAGRGTSPRVDSATMHRFVTLVHGPLPDARVWIVDRDGQIVSASGDANAHHREAARRSVSRNSPVLLASDGMGESLRVAVATPMHGTASQRALVLDVPVTASLSRVLPNLPNAPTTRAAVTLPSGTGFVGLTWADARVPKVGWPGSGWALRDSSLVSVASMLGDSIHLELAIPRTAVESAASARLAWAHVVTIVLALGACVIALLLGRARHNEHLAAAERSLAATKLRAAQAEAAATRASLAEISARMNPHFLANAMHSVSALIAADPVAAEEAIDRLGDLFRASVDRSEQQVVRLEDEWQFVQDYLAIEQLRLGSRLRVALDLDPDARDCLVPTFILQPLVENAVRHGVAPMPHGGLVTVRARRVTGEIILDVSDDGAGADVAFVESARGTGLRTLRQRLALDPNARGRMELEASPGRGFRVRVVVADARDSDGPPWASPAASQVGATRSKA